MSFNPFKEKGIPIENQITNWSKLNSKPFNKNEVHPYTYAVPRHSHERY